MASEEDHKHITTVLIPELLKRFNDWGREYRQPRDLGILGEFVGLYRKARKLKTLLWDRRDGDPPPEAAGWREGPRDIMMEVVAHGLLMLCDWDRAHPETTPIKLGESPTIVDATNAKSIQDVVGMLDADAPNYEVDSDQEDEKAFPGCHDGCRLAQRHTYGAGCALHNTEEARQAIARMDADAAEVVGLFFPDCGEDCNKIKKHVYRGDCGLADEASFSTRH